MPQPQRDRPIEDLGARIRRLRQEQRLAQDRLALRADVDQSSLSKFERGRDRGMSTAAIERIAAVLGISYDELVAGTDRESE